MKFEIRWCASTIDSVEKSHSVGRIGLEKFMWAAISRNNVGNPDLIPSWYIDCFLSRSPHVRLNDNIDCTDSSVHYARRRLPVAISYRISRISSPCFFSFSLYFFPPAISSLPYQFFVLICSSLGYVACTKHTYSL